MVHSQHTLCVATPTNRYRKRCAARIQKQLGDINLLLGNASTAVTHYLFSIKVFKDTNDFLWLGGAFEGMAACLLVQDSLETTDRESEIVSKFREASSLYFRNKGGSQLRMEVIFKVAGYLQSKGNCLGALQELSGIFDVAELDLDNAGRLVIYKLIVYLL